MKNPGNIDWLSEEIVLRHRKDTYMATNKIKKVLALVSRKKIFADVSKKLSKTKNELKEDIDKIFKRRNKIAHQSDREHETSELYKIDKKEVEEYIDLIEKFVKEVHNIIVNDI